MRHGQHHNPLPGMEAPTAGKCSRTARRPSAVVSRSGRGGGEARRLDNYSSKPGRRRCSARQSRGLLSGCGRDVDAECLRRAGPGCAGCSWRGRYQGRHALSELLASQPGNGTIPRFQISSRLCWRTLARQATEWAEMGVRGCASGAGGQT